MKFLGLEIKRAADSNKMASAMSPSWISGSKWLSGKDFHAMVKAYKSWIYVCASKNSTTVSKQCLNLYAAKPVGRNVKVIAGHKTISNQQKAYLAGINTIKNLTSVRKSEEIIEITEHPFLDLLNRANPFMSGTELIEMTSLFLELTGNAYWYIVKDDTFNIPVQIWSVPAQFMKVIPGGKDIISGYVYSQHAKDIPFDTDEIIHFKYPNPNDFFYGVSPLMAVADAYNTNENILQFTNALFTNMARPEGVLHTEQDLTQSDFEVLKKQWDAAYGGVSKARKTAVLPKGLKYTPITMTPRELDYVEGRAVVKEEICNAFGQSVALYSEKANRANSEQAYLSFLRDAIQPRLRRIEETINCLLMPLYDSSIFVVFDNPVPDDKEFRLKQIESNLRSGYSVINEERQLDGRGEVSWGSVPIMSQNMTPLGSAPISPAGTSPSSADDTKFVVRQLVQRLRAYDHNRI